jgi:hypothetical protein
LYLLGDAFAATVSLQSHFSSVNSNAQGYLAVPARKRFCRKKFRARLLRD